MKSHFSLTHILQNQQGIFEDIKQHDSRLWRSLPWLLLLSIGALALFGAALGAVVPNGWHSVATSWKMIVLLWGSLLIVAPSLYVFGSIRGAQFTLTQYMGLLVSSMAVAGIVLLALTPISGFFTWTNGGNSELVFLQVLNGVCIGLALLFGISFMQRGIRFIQVKDHGSDAKPVYLRDVLAIWYVLFIVVIIQMAGELGPWYSYRTEPVLAKRGDILFPVEPQGTFASEPAIQTSEAGDVTISWATTSTCAVNEVQYVEANYTGADGEIWGGTSATCTNTSPNTCTATIGKELLNGDPLYVQLSHSGCGVSGDLFENESDNNLHSEVIEIR